MAKIKYGWSPNKLVSVVDLMSMNSVELFRSVSFFVLVEFLQLESPITKGPWITSATKIPNNSKPFDLIIDLIFFTLN